MSDEREAAFETLYTGMFHHLLIPLDGSRLAEAVLPAVERLSVRFQAAVTLLHVLEQQAPTTIHGERHLTDSAEAETYLGVVADRLRAAGIVVTTHVHDAREGDVAHSIVEHAKEINADLVLICTHGSSGLRGVLFGSIAQQVLPTYAVIACPGGAALGSIGSFNFGLLLHGSQEVRLHAPLPPAGRLSVDS